MNRFFTSLLVMGALCVSGAQAQTLTFADLEEEDIPSGSSLTFDKLNESYKAMGCLMINGNFYVLSDAACSTTMTLTHTSGDLIEFCVGALCRTPGEVVTVDLDVSPEQPALFDLHLGGFSTPITDVLTGRARLDVKGGNSNIYLNLLMTNDPNASVHGVAAVEESMACDGRTLSWAGQQPGTLRLIAADGHVAFQTAADAEGTVTPDVPAGIYVVTLGNQSMKVAIK